MKILYGKDVVTSLTQKINMELTELNGYIPNLAIVRVGDNPDDMAYEKGAVKRFEKSGMKTTLYTYDADIKNDDFINRFKKINDDKNVDAILLMRPLAKQIDEKAVCNIINPDKDVDCIGPVNIAKVFSSDSSGFAPCTAQAVIEMIDYANIDLTGKRAVVVGRSMVIGKPVAMMLMKKNATVTICHTRTKEMQSVCKQAEVLIAAAGSPEMINADYVSKGAYVFDVGINVDKDGNLSGDVDMDSITDIAALCTPVPRGVGTVTTSVLAMHVIRAAKMNKNR